ncbi:MULTISPECIES: Bsp6I family type II restriction endonuclease [unclassified Moraxella]|uniref:Bsp6I family type II restriction endonuclease n=1 Tax=unclassified Moraxella TaxID=2685852 RepID=UPI003AF82D9D
MTATNNVTDNDLKLILTAYHHWKVLNQSLKAFASRTVNFPEAISKALVCYQLGYEWHNKTTTKNVGDASFNGKLVEIKATSNFNSDLTSFSPDTKFDILIFARLNLAEDQLYLYDLNLNFSQFQQLQVNKTQTILQQQQSGRRPRLRIIENMIIPNQLQPTAVLDLKALASQLGVSL